MLQNFSLEMVKLVNFILCIFYHNFKKKPSYSAVKIMRKLSMAIAPSQTWWMFLNLLNFLEEVWQTSTPQSNTVQEGQGFSVRRESGPMTGSRVAMLGRLSWFSTKRLKLQRLCWSLNELSSTTDLRECLAIKRFIFNWGDIRRERAKWSSPKLHILCYYVIIKSWDMLKKTDHEGKTEMKKPYGERPRNHLQRVTQMSQHESWAQFPDDAAWITTSKTSRRTEIDNPHSDWKLLNKWNHVILRHWFGGGLLYSIITKVICTQFYTEIPFSG